MYVCIYVKINVLQKTNGSVLNQANAFVVYKRARMRCFKCKDANVINDLTEVISIASKKVTTLARKERVRYQFRYVVILPYSSDPVDFTL